MTSNGRAALIALDWGTTSLRAYLVDAGGAILDRRRSEEGIRNVPDGDFAGTYARAVHGWDASLPALACGMIGSRNGWLEAPYCDAPVGVDALAAALARVPGAGLAIVPGVRTVDRHGDPDVMRGEETQLVGAAGARREAAVFVHPGTHSKWATVREGRITGFATWMTGELHATLLKHSILGAFQPGPTQREASAGRTKQAETAGQAQPEASAGRGGRPASAAAPGADGFDWSPFDRGVARANAQADFTHALFTARSRVLEADLEPGQVPEYLSGLLIGEEIRGARTSGWLDGVPRGSRITLIGSDRLVTRYARAFDRCGVACDVGAPDVVVAGLLAIARAARLVR